MQFFAERYSYDDVFESFSAIGISDFVFDWPDEGDLHAFEAAAREALPGWRRGA